METSSQTSKKRKFNLRRSLAGLLFGWSLSLNGCRSQDQREIFTIAWLMAIRVVHDEPEVREAAERELSPANDERIRMRKLLVLPCYALLRIVRSLLPEEHPLKHADYETFARGATDMAVLFGAFFWGQFFLAVFLVSYLASGI